MHNAQRKRRRVLGRQLSQPRTPAAKSEAQPRFDTSQAFTCAPFTSSPTQTTFIAANKANPGLDLPFQVSNPSLPDPDEIDMDANTWSTGSLDKDLLDGVDIEGLLKSLESDQMTQTLPRCMPALQPMLSSVTDDPRMEQPPAVNWPAITPSIAPLVNVPDQLSVNLSSGHHGNNPFIFGAAFQSATSAVPWNPPQPESVQERMPTDPVPHQMHPQALIAESTELVNASYSLFNMAPSQLPADVHSALASTLDAPTWNTAYQTHLNRQ